MLDNLFPVLHEVEYDNTKIKQMINDYSIKTGATLVKKSFFNVSASDKGRFISIKKIEFPKNNKIINLSTEANEKYDYVILQNESEFIKTVIASFQTYPFVNYKHPYILLNFSKIYDIKKTNN